MTEQRKPTAMSVFDFVGGLSSVDAQALEPFLRAMDKAIPEMVRAEKARRELAEEARRRQLT